MPEDRICLLIVDDHAVVRKGQATVVRLEPDFEVIGEAGDGDQALALGRRYQPYLVLMDLVMPGMDGQTAARRLKRELPEVRVLVLTGTELGEGVVGLLAGGVDG